MKNIWIITGMLILSMALGAPGFCSSCNGESDYNGHFGDLDQDGDDQVTWKEFKAHFPQAEPKVFEEADKNRDKSIGHDEWHEFKAHRGYSHKHKD